MTPRHFGRAMINTTLDHPFVLGAAHQGIDLAEPPRKQRGKMVLPERIELSTSPLPRECSTTELRQQAGAS
jgi:hypothetical protein